MRMIRSYEKNGKILWEAQGSKRTKDARKGLFRKRRGLASEQAAKRAEHQIYAELEALAADDPAKHMTWDRLVDNYFKHPTTRSKYNAATLVRRESAMRPTMEKWAYKRITEIQSSDIMDYLTFVGDEHKWSSSYRELQLKGIRAVFDFATLHGHTERNPCVSIKLSSKSPELAIWSGEQLRTFLAGVRKMDENWWRVFTLAALTGMRYGELMGLRWERIDFDKGLIRVCETYAPQTGEYRLTTKNGETRLVPMNAELRTFLEAWPADKAPRDFVLPRSGALMSAQQAVHLKHFAKLLGLPPVRFHDLRGMFACQAHISGIPVHYIMKICGWKELKTVQRYLRMSGAEIMGATDSFTLGVGA